MPIFLPKLPTLPNAPSSAAEAKEWAERLIPHLQRMYRELATAIESVSKVAGTGAPGAQGVPGVPTFLAAEPGMDGEPGAPGRDGAAGTTGATGGIGPAGPAIFLTSEPGEEGPIGMPGPVNTQNEFIDSLFRVVDDGDNTKKLALQCSGIAAATTRTVTAFNFDGRMALLHGTNNTLLCSNGSEAIAFGTTATPANIVRFTQGATGVGPTINIFGEVNVDLNLSAAGTGFINLSTFPVTLTENAADPASPPTNVLALYAKDSTSPSSGLYAKDDAGNVYSVGLIKRISGNSGAAGPDETWQILTSDSSTITTTTLSASVLSTTGVGVGTWRFRYYVLYQTAATTTGMAFGVNHTGTVTKFRAGWYHTTTGTTAASGVGTGASSANTGQLVEGNVGTTLNAIIGVAQAGVAVANSDVIAVIEGIIVVSVTGTLELKIASEVAASGVLLKTSSHLELKRIA